MKKDRNSFFESNFNMSANTNPMPMPIPYQNMPNVMANSSYYQSNMPLNYPMYANEAPINMNEIDARIAKLERSINRLEARINHLESNLQMILIILMEICIWFKKNLLYQK